MDIKINKKGKKAQEVNIPKNKKIIVEVENPKTDAEYEKLIDKVNENFKIFYSVKD